MSRVRSQLTFANVISCLALFVALGGSAYALQVSSVGTKALKDGAVTNAKLHADAVTASKIKGATITGAQVRPGSLLAGDFQSGQLPKGPPGPPGLPGLPGPQGPSNAYLRVINLPTAIGTTGGASIGAISDLPAGKYAITATVWVQNNNSSAQIVQCRFDLGAVSAQSLGEATLQANSGDGSQEATLPVADTVTLAKASNSVSLVCDAELPSTSVLNASIVAIKVASLTENRDPVRG